MTNLLIICFLYGVQLALICLFFYFLLKIFLIISSYGQTDLIFVPSVHRVFKRFIKELKENEKFRQKVVPAQKSHKTIGKEPIWNYFIDLGAGYGSIVEIATRSKLFKKSVGIEKRTTLWFLGNFRLFTYRLVKKEVQFLKENFFEYPLDKVDFVYVFLLPQILKKLAREKFNKELKSGTIILSWMFEIEGLKADLVETFKVPSIGFTLRNLYVYRMK